MNRIPICDEAVARAMAETARLQRELDITNADHIALWLEANTIPDEPMNQCASWLACRIVEAHEAASAEAAKLIESLVGISFPALIYIFECSDDDNSSRVAKEAADKIEHLLSQAHTEVLLDEGKER